MLYLGLFIALVLIVLAAIASLNALTFPRLATGNAPAVSRQPPFAAHGLISVLIPARNEAAIIGDTVRALLGQTGVDFEVIVLDDHSADGTGAAARAAGGGDPRLRVLAGEPLPPGWLGKNWACHQLARAAAGDWLLFTDADVQWRPGALAALAGMRARTEPDLLTIWPTQITQTWGERLAVSLIALVVIAYLPALAVHHLPGRIFSAANGQCLLFRRAAYERVGGHAAVRGDILEDVALAARVKGAGLRLRMADGAGLIACRMYRNWPEVRDGFAKNILAGHGGRPALLLLSTLFHWLVFVFPWLWAMGSWGLRMGDWELALAASSFPLSLVLLGVTIRALTAAVTGQRVRDALLMPVSVMLMTVIAARSLYWRYTGGPRWKGRALPEAR